MAHACVHADAGTTDTTSSDTPVGSVRELVTLPRPSRASLRRSTTVGWPASPVGLGWIWMKKSAVVVVSGPRVSGVVGEVAGAALGGYYFARREGAGDGIGQRGLTGAGAGDRLRVAARTGWILGFLECIGCCSCWQLRCFWPARCRGSRGHAAPTTAPWRWSTVGCRRPSGARWLPR